MANGKRGHRAGKKNRDPTENATVDSSIASASNTLSPATNVDAANPVHPTMFDSIDTCESSQFDTSKDTRPGNNIRTDPSQKETQQCEDCESLQLTVQNLQNELTSANEKVAQTEELQVRLKRVQDELGIANSLLSEKEFREYKEESETQEMKNAGQQANREMDRKYKTQAVRIAQLQNLLENSDVLKDAKFKECRAVKSREQSLRARLNNAEGVIRSQEIECQDALIQLEELKRKLISTESEKVELQEAKKNLIKDYEQLLEHTAVLEKASNVTLEEELASRHDTTANGSSFEALKEEVVELRQTKKELQRRLSHQLQDEKSSDSWLCDRDNRHQSQQVALVMNLQQELKGELEDGDGESDENEETSQHRLKEIGTQTNEPVTPADKTSASTDIWTQTDSFTQAEHATQTDFIQAAHATQTDRFVQAQHATQTYSAIQVEHATQTDGNHPVEVAIQKSKMQVDTAIQLEKPADSFISTQTLSAPRNRLCYWLFIIAACFLILMAAFSFYHGLQARAERAMWLSANDYSRRAVIHYRAASARGERVPWMTTEGIRKLKLGYAGGFRRAGVEM